MVETMTVDGNDLKRWRKANGYSQAELARGLGVERNTVSRWELGEREFPAFLELALKQLEGTKKEDESER